MGNGPATSGHYALRRVLRCPDIDVLCSPISYFDRGPGESAPAMTRRRERCPGRQNVALRRRHADLPGQRSRFAHVDTIEKTNRELLRNTGQCALRELRHLVDGLGRHRLVQRSADVGGDDSLSALDEPLLKTPRPFRPQVAAVIDPQSMIRVAAGGQAVTTPGVYEARRPLGRMARPIGQYLQDDVAAGRVAAKMYVFLSAWCLSPAERRQLLHATRGAPRVWCYAPGFQEENRTSLEAMRELTGFQLKHVSPASAGQSRPTRDGSSAYGSPSGCAGRSRRCLPPAMQRRPRPWRPIRTARPRWPCAAPAMACPCLRGRPA